MTDKHLIFGATGSIGSSLARQLKDSNQDAHLVSRNKEELKIFEEKLEKEKEEMRVKAEEEKN